MPSVTANFSAALSTVHSAQRDFVARAGRKTRHVFCGRPLSHRSGIALLEFGHAHRGDCGRRCFPVRRFREASYATGNGPVSVAIATFNSKNGGHPDLAVANQTDGTISILTGNGDGTFVAPLTPCTAPSCIALPAVTTARVTTNASPSAIVTGDFNDDGFMDLAVTDAANNRVMILLGNGDGTFQPAGILSDRK